MSPLTQCSSKYNPIINTNSSKAMPSPSKNNPAYGQNICKGQLWRRAKRRYTLDMLQVISKWYHMWYFFLASFWYQSDITCDILQYLFMISKWYHLWYHKVISLWYHFDIIVISLHLFIPIALWYIVFSLLFLMKCKGFHKF